jgi:2-oxoglutarate/2-oxoacid ferredoxin oxidoreductase subunit alpha
MLTDLDLGMNDWMSPPLVFDDKHAYDRGKVLDSAALENLKERFGRYLDVDGDGIPYRTYPGAHPKKGAYTTRGTSRDEYAIYTEDGAAYVRNVDRLLRKFETAKRYVPEPRIKAAARATPVGALFFGTTASPAYEAVEMLAEEGIAIDTLRLRAFPFTAAVEEFIAGHETVFVIEQNRDGQMRRLLINETEVSAKEKLVPVLNYDGLPITARQIAAVIRSHLGGTDNVTPINRKRDSARKSKS